MLVWEACRRRGRYPDNLGSEMLSIGAGKLETMLQNTEMILSEHRSPRDLAVHAGSQNKLGLTGTSLSTMKKVTNCTRRVVRSSPSSYGVVGTIVTDSAEIESIHSDYITQDT